MIKAAVATATDTIPNHKASTKAKTTNTRTSTTNTRTNTTNTTDMRTNMTDMTGMTPTIRKLIKSQKNQKMRIFLIPDLYIHK